MRRWLESFLNKLAPPAVEGRAVIRFDDTTLRLIDRSLANPVWVIRWDAVKEIVAWKDDFFAYDVINIGFRIADVPEYFSCNETEIGWGKLAETVRARFVLSQADWYTRIAVPAFQTNWTVLHGQAWHFPCRYCGYGLRMSRSRCPECSRAVPDNHEENAIVIHAAHPYNPNR